MPKYNDDGLSMVDQLLTNEKAGVPKRGGKEPYNKNFKKKKYTKKEVYTYTDADLVLSGWNLKFDPDYVEPHKVGDVIDGIEVHKVGSLYNVACVYCPEYWIYGWGVNVDEAINDCKKNVNTWKKNNPGKKPLAHPKKKTDASAADILEEVGL